MKSIFSLKKATLALLLAVSSSAFADCPYGTAQVMTYGDINNFVRSKGAIYNGFKMAYSVNPYTQVSEVLFTFVTTTFGSNGPLQETWIGAKHLDQYCQNIDSKISIAEPVYAK